MVLRSTLLGMLLEYISTLLNKSFYDHSVLDGACLPPKGIRILRFFESQCVHDNY